MAVNWDAIFGANRANPVSPEEKEKQRLNHGATLALELKREAKEKAEEAQRQRYESFYQQVGMYPPGMQSLNQMGTFLGTASSSFPVANGSITVTRSPLEPWKLGSPVQASVIEQFKKVEPYRALQRVPDSIDMIVGWRTWRTTRRGGQWWLQALGQSTAWEPKKKVEAACIMSGRPTVSGTGDHPAPQKDCTCGFWAFKNVDMLPGAVAGQCNDSQITVMGSVDLWGRVVETENGFRAQYAYPKELWLLEDHLEELSWTYGVPVRRLTAKDAK